MDEYINTPEEAQMKEKLWTTLNAEYLAEQALKQASSSGSATPKPRPPKRNRDQVSRYSSNSPADAAVEMLKRKVSTKINYAALTNLFKVEDTLFPRPNVTLPASAGHRTAHIPVAFPSTTSATINPSPLSRLPSVIPPVNKLVPTCDSDDDEDEPRNINDRYSDEEDYY